MLSRFAGAAIQMTAAVIVNPYDIEATGEALQTALHMPLDERKERWSEIFDDLSRDDVLSWTNNFISALTDESEGAA